MDVVVRVELLGSCRDGPVDDALRSRARVERPSSNEYVAHVEDAADGASAVAELEREPTPDWDELVRYRTEPRRRGSEANSTGRVRVSIRMTAGIWRAWTTAWRSSS
jgi:hypothetical protein